MAGHPDNPYRQGPARPDILPLFKNLVHARTSAGLPAAHRIPRPRLLWHPTALPPSRFTPSVPDLGHGRGRSARSWYTHETASITQPQAHQDPRDASGVGGTPYSCLNLRQYLVMGPGIFHRDPLPVDTGRPAKKRFPLPGKDISVDNHPQTMTEHTMNIQSFLPAPPVHPRHEPHRVPLQIAYGSFCSLVFTAESVCNQSVI